MSDNTSTIDRRRVLTELAIGESAEVERLSRELASARSGGNPLDPERIRDLAIAAAKAIGTDDLPRGYRLLGGTAKTPHYLQHGGRPATDSQILSDFLAGWFVEIAERQKTALARYADKPNSTPRMTIGPSK